MLLLSRHTCICKEADIFGRIAVTVALSSPYLPRKGPIQTHDVDCIALIILCTFYIKKIWIKVSPSQLVIKRPLLILG